MGVTHGINMLLILLVLVGYAWGFGLSKTWKRLDQTNEGKLSLEDIPLSFCSMATSSTCRNFMMNFFDLVNVVEEGELSRADGEDAEEP